MKIKTIFRLSIYYLLFIIFYWSCKSNEISYCNDINKSGPVVSIFNTNLNLSSFEYSTEINEIDTTKSHEFDFSAYDQYCNDKYKIKFWIRKNINADINGKYIVENNLYYTKVNYFVGYVLHEKKSPFINSLVYFNSGEVEIVNLGKNKFEIKLDVISIGGDQIFINEIFQY